MLFLIYKITNKINGKFYIGKHQTKDIDDGYMGSGKLISRAISKYGLENFHKEILHIFDNEEDMNSKEKELVVISENSYNLYPGGKGGFGYINSNTEILERRDTKENKRKAAFVANAKGAYKKGKERTLFLMKNDPEWMERYRANMRNGQSKVKKEDCPYCGKQGLNPGNMKKHLRKHIDNI